MMEREHRWENLWTCVTEDGYCGYVNSLAEAEQVRKEFEVEKSLTFVSGKREADFGNHGHGLYISITVEIDNACYRNFKG